MEAGGFVTFYRTLHWQDAIRTYSIEIDGVVRGSLRPRSTATFDVAPGRHVCRASIAWTGSHELEVVVPAGTELRLHVKPGKGLPTSRAHTADGWLTLELDP